MIQNSSSRQPIQYALAGLLIIVTIWLIIKLQPLISALIIAGLIAYILHPLVNLLIRRTKLSHSGAVTIVYLIFLLLLIAIPAVLTPIIIAQTREFIPDIEFLTERLKLITETPVAIAGFSIPLNNVFADLESSIAQTVTQIAPNLGFVLADVSTNFLWGLIVLVSVYYLLRDSHRLHRWILSYIPIPYHRHTNYLLHEMDLIWGSFLRGQLLLMLIVGILSWLGTMAVGMPAALIIGVIAGVLDIIPSLGPTLAAIIAVVIALFEGSNFLPISNWLFATIVLAIFLIVQQMENIWIRPALMGRRLRLHPAIVFISVLTSLALFGILVTLIIIPLLSSLAMIVRYIRDREWEAEGFLPPSAED